jgi:hypothetical protein
MQNTEDLVKGAILRLVDHSHFLQQDGIHTHYSTQRAIRTAANADNDDDVTAAGWPKTAA